MTPAQDARIAAMLRVFARLAGAAVALLGAAVLVGWGIDSEPLKRVAPGLVAMKPNAALGFALAGTALLALASGRARAATGLAWAVAALGAVTLAQDVTALDLGIDELLFRDAAEPLLTGAPGRMSPLAAVSFVLAGASLVQLAARRGSVLVAQLCAVAAASIPLVVLAGYAMSLEAFYTLPRYTSMALHTAIGLLVLVLGTLAARPGEGFVATLSGGSEGSLLARRLLPFALTLPIVIAAAIYAGEAGQLIGRAFGLALGSVATSLVLSALIWWAARAVDQKARELARQRRWFATTLASIGDGVIVTDVGERIVFINAEAQRLTGWDEAQARGRPLGEVFRIVSESDRRPVELPTRQVLREGRVVGLANHTLLIARDGSELPIDDSAAPIASDSEGLLGVVLVFRDVADRRARQRELLESREQLVARARELELQDQRKDEFLAVLGHELRNPLAAIASGVRLLEDETPDLTWIRGMMDRQVDQLVGLLNDLLDLTRISRGKIRLRRSVQELAPIVREVAESHAAEIARGRLELRLDLAEGLHLDADRTRLGQVISNLLGNAVKFTHAGGHITLAARRDGDSIAIDVSDDGIGMDAPLLERCFAPFAQEKPGGGGLGIGLALVKQLVELHDGTVSAHSDGPGRGSTFRVRLPACGAAQAQDVAPVRALRPDAPLAGLRVLIVDDNRDAALGLSALLEREGCRVEAAFSGQAGLAAARAMRPDAVLLDLSLPDLHGGKVAARLRADPELNGTLIVAVTGLGHEQSRRLVREEDFDSRLVKPVDFAELAALLSLRRRSDGIV